MQTGIPQKDTPQPDSTKISFSGLIALQKFFCCHAAQASILRVEIKTMWTNQSSF
jgi:hypothetical protein